MKISLVINSNKPNNDYLKEAIDSAPINAFDEVILYLNNQNPASAVLPKFNKKVLLLADGADRNCADGFNYAIGWAEGEWILPFCDDDIFLTDNLAFLINYLRTNEKKLPNKHVIHYPCMVNGKDEWGEGFFTLNDLKKGNCIPFSCIYRKKVWEEVGGYKNNLPFNDWVFWLEVMNHNYNFFYNPEPIYNFRVIKDSLSQKELNFQSFEKTRNQILEFISNKYGKSQ